MVEYVAIMLGGIGLMFLLFETGFRLGTPSFIQNEVMDLMDMIKMFFFFSAFTMGFMVIGLMNLIAGENTASVNFTKFTGLFFWVWGIIFILSVFGMLIYFIWWIPKKVQEKINSNKRESEDL